VQEKKIHIVSNTLNINEFEIPDEKPDKEYITLLYAGGINKHRGLQYVIKGLKYFNESERKLRLWILGTGSYVEDLKDLVKVEKMGDRVFFEGWKNYKEMQTYFGKSDICLIPHIKSDHTDSTIPHKIFQYMYAGKPMLVSNCLPLKRIVNETHSGKVFDFNNPKDFAIKLTQLLDDKRYLDISFSKNCQEIITYKYNWRIDSQILINIYLKYDNNIL
jgi:glycosyltransferase involved in cell wall biosynthesis